jgi:hypothetical protein
MSVATMRRSRPVGGGMLCDVATRVTTAGPRMKATESLKEVMGSAAVERLASERIPTAPGPRAGSMDMKIRTLIPACAKSRTKAIATHRRARRAWKLANTRRALVTAGRTKTVENTNTGSDKALSKYGAERAPASGWNGTSRQIVAARLSSKRNPEADRTKPGTSELVSSRRQASRLACVADLTGPAWCRSWLDPHADSSAAAPSPTLQHTKATFTPRTISQHQPARIALHAASHSGHEPKPDRSG